MSSDARALPLRDAPLGGTPARSRRRLGGWRAGALAGTQAQQRLGAICLLTIVAASVLVVLAAADRPSLLSPTTHAHFVAHWMAGRLGGLWGGLPRDSTTLRWLFTGAIAAMYAAYLLAFAYGSALRARWVIAAVAVTHLVFLMAPPLALTDAFNYINYGRMEVVHQLNPYTTIPILEPHGDPSYSLSNWHQLLSPYGPLFTLLTFAVVPLGVAASFWALKVTLAAASLGMILLVWRCARLLGRDPVKAIVLVGLNPVVLVWGLGGGHNDALMMFLIVLGFYLLLRMRTQRAPAAGEARRWLRPISPAGIGAGSAFVTA